jgi:flagellar biosynthesis protein FliQ
METQVVIDLMQESFQMALFLAMPSLMAALIVGVIISIFQSVTSIQEQTLVFVPKMLAVMIALIVTFSWMLSKVIHFTEALFQNIPNYIN